MRFGWRLGFLAMVALAAFALVWIRTSRHVTPATTSTAVKRSSPKQETPAPLNQPGGPDAPQDAYPVYSALYQSPVEEPLAFAKDSWTDVPQVGQSCLRPSTAEEHGMADAFITANRQSHQWQKAFSIPQGYTLLSTSETAEARSCLSPAARVATECGKWKHLRYVRLLGVPAFNPAHSRVLVSVIKSCGGFCGSGGIFELRLSGNVWQRSAATDFTRNCSWIY